MAFINIFDFEESSGLLKKEYEKGMRRAGRIWKILSIQSQTPQILQDSMRLYGSTMFGNTSLTKFDRELLAVVTSLTNECEYWIRAHLYDLRSETEDQKLIDQVAKDWKKHIELCKFAEKLTIDPKNINKNDIELLKTFEFNEIEISEIVQVISYFNYINRVADGLGLEPEKFIDELGYKINIDE